MNFSGIVCALIFFAASTNTLAKDHASNIAPAKGDVTTITPVKADSRTEPTSTLIQLQQRAANRDPQAQYELGTRYLKGVGVNQDNAAAFAWFNQSAANNYAEAQFMLAGMYDEGLAVAQDFQTAADWNLKAAEQGHAGALYNLGMLYIAGDGVPRDLVQAHMWFNLSAAKGNVAGVDGRKQCEVKMSQWQLGEAQSRAREWQARFR